MKCYHTIIFVLLVAQWCCCSEPSAPKKSAPIPIPQNTKTTAAYSQYYNLRNTIYIIPAAKQEPKPHSYQHGMFEHHEEELYSYNSEDEVGTFVSDGILTWHTSENYKK